MSQGNDQRLKAAHERVAALPRKQQMHASVRLSRSYSSPAHCVRFNGCRIEGDEVVWPDGERWPADTGRLAASPGGKIEAPEEPISREPPVEDLCTNPLVRPPSS